MESDDTARVEAGFEARLTRLLARVGLSPVTACERLSGGASMESWRFTSGADDYVLRRAASLALMDGRPMSHAVEAAVIRAAAAAGVRAPQIVALLEPGDELGSGFVMRALPGTADPAAILAGRGGEALLGEIGAQLAAIHRLDPPDLPALDAAAGVAELSRRFIDYGGDRPILALALHWLAGNVPAPVAPRLVHGDLRMGNLLVEDGALTGVLDWELAHRGDPHEDLAYGCMTVWRFARADRAAFGLGSIESLIAAYQAAGGAPVDPARFRFWLVYRTTWWALGCLQMGTYWRDGSDRSVERAVIARRTGEQELDLLLLLEGDAPAGERAAPLPPAPAAPAPPRGETTAAELVTAVQEWLAAAKPLFAGRARFEHAVARNALGIVVRELAGRPDPADAALAARLLAGEDTLATPGLLARLRRRALGTLSSDMPKYPALALARAAWNDPAN